MISIRFIFFVIASVCISISGTAQTTYTVDEVDLGIGTAGGTLGSLDTDGSLDVMMENALISANAGNVVVINMDADNLVNVDEPLPILEITHSSGKITITKAVGAAVDQGIVFAGGTFDQGFAIISSKGDVVIDHLTIKGFNFGFELQPQLDGDPGSITITNNYILQNSQYGIYGSGSGYGDFANVNISDNTIEGWPFFYYSDGHFGIYLSLVNTFSHPNDYSDATFTIDNNTILYYREGIHFVNSEHYLEMEATVLITDNDIDLCNTGILLANPKMTHYTVTGNSLSNMYYSGLIINTYNYTSIVGSTSSIHSVFPCNFNFIEAGNMLGLSAENAGNTFVECRFNAILLDATDEINIVNLNVQGEINGFGGKPYSVRETRFSRPTYYQNSPGAIFGPIFWDMTNTNEGIPMPVPLAAYIEGATLTLSYNTPGLFAANGSFDVEFFEANEDNSLIQFLGSETHLTAAAGPHTTVLSGVSFTTGTQIGMTVTSTGDQGEKIGTSQVSYTPISTIPCDTCTSFKPIAGNRYWVSAWVLEDHIDPVKSYSDATLQLNFIRPSLSSYVEFHATGEIIDGWQRIVGEFTMPYNVTDFIVQLNAHPTVDTYFDDIRIHPFNGSMKSYVYDGETFWLVSELDDNNYATFYEYDQEGGLVRIKKETSRGVVTIQETRSNTVKQDN